MDDLLVTGPDLFIVAIVVLWVGDQITKRISLLEKYSIPIAVTGGLLCSILVAILAAAGGPAITFDMSARDTLLMVFFSTIGLSAKLSRLKSGGKALAILVVCAAVFLVLQDMTGVLIMKLLGAPPAYGLFAGSVSLAGGHGTAIAWGQEAEAAGLSGAAMLGVAFATFGLVTGGIIGGPVAEHLIRKHKLHTNVTENLVETDSKGESKEPLTLHRILSVLFVLAICLSLGEVVNRWLLSNEIKLPGFLTAMMVGIAITNLADRLNRPLDEKSYGIVGEVALQLFLAMSLMSMNLLAIGNVFGSIFVALAVQTVVITLFAVMVVYRVMGRDYDAAVIAGGFCGLGMGATPVAIANMDAVTEKHGSSFKAFLVIPLVGAFFVDLLNAVVIKFFIGLPFMQNG